MQSAFALRMHAEMTRNASPAPHFSRYFFISARRPSRRSARAMP